MAGPARPDEFLTSVFCRPFFIDSSKVRHVAYLRMLHSAGIDRELAAASLAWEDGNEGKARVCARRAVALAAESWLARLAEPMWRGDAMEHLRRIQLQVCFPLPVRQAAERLYLGDAFSDEPYADWAIELRDQARDLRRALD